MYRRILLAIDMDGLADSALPIVAALARQSDGEVLVLNVRQVDQESHSRQSATVMVDAVCAKLAESGVRSRGEVRNIAHGRPSAPIVEEAKRYQADLVALGSHGRGDLAGLFVHSTGHEVAAHLNCPILIVRRAAGSPGQPVSRILLAVDLSEEAQVATANARDLAVEAGAEVVVVHVRETLIAGEGAAYVEPDADAQAAVDQAVAFLSAAGVRAESRVLPSVRGVAFEIAAAAEVCDAGLIVLGSRRLTDLGGLVLGSVAHALINQTRRPVLLAERVAAHAPGALR